MNMVPMKNMRALKVLTGIVLAVLAVFLVAKTRTAWAERDYLGVAAREPDTILISGTGKVSATPDIAKISVGIYSDGVTVAAVQQDSTTKMNAITAALKTMGIADADLQTSGYNLQPKIDYSNGKQNITGYTLSQNLDVKVRDLSKAGDVIQKAVDLGANQVGGVQFTIDDPSSLQDQARLKAIKNAQEKAQQIADATGLHIVKIVTFSESNGNVQPPIPYAMDFAAAGSAKAMAPAVQAGSLDVATDVSVTFEVR